MRDILGGKGAGLAEMTNAGLPVPPGFTIQTEACREYMRGSLSAQVTEQMDLRSLAWKSCRGSGWAQGRIHCWSASARAQSFPCRG